MHREENLNQNIKNLNLFHFFLILKSWESRSGRPRCSSDQNPGETLNYGLSTEHLSTEHLSTWAVSKWARRFCFGSICVWAFSFGSWQLLNWSIMIQAGFKGHKTRQELRSKSNDKEDTPKKEHEGLKKKTLNAEKYSQHWNGEAPTSQSLWLWSSQNHLW